MAMNNKKLTMPYSGVTTGRQVTGTWLDEEIVDRAKPTYSIVEIILKDGKTIEFMCKASPSVTSHLVREMQNSGFLTLWNDTDTLCVAASEVKHFVMREVIKQE